MAKQGKPIVVDDADVQRAADVVLGLPPEQLAKIKSDAELIKLAGDAALLYSFEASEEWRQEFIRRVKRRVEFGLAASRRGEKD